MNIVYGGSFNPPTLAHKLIVEELMNKFKYENLIILPVGNSYKKTDLAPFSHRYKMLEIMLKDYRVIISDIEKNEFLGTYNSLKLLSKDYDDLYFVMGADNFNYLDKWIRYEDLLKEFKFIIFNRSNNNLSDMLKKYEKYKDNFILVDLNIDISSTNIRKSLEDYKGDLDLNVYNYILEYNLY